MTLDLDFLWSEDYTGDLSPVLVVPVDYLWPEDYTGDLSPVHVFTSDFLWPEDYVSNLNPVLKPAPNFLWPEDFCSDVRPIYSQIPGPSDKTIFYLTLTGGENATTDLDLSGRLGSFSCRRRSGDPTSFEVALVGAATIAADISARAAGQLVIEMVILSAITGVVKGRIELARAYISSVQAQYGPKSSSVQITGFATITNNNAASWTLTKVTTRSDTNGVVSLQLPNIHFGMIPGDTVTYGADTFTVSRISYSVSERQTVMSVSEGA